MDMEIFRILRKKAKDKALSLAKRTSGDPEVLRILEVLQEEDFHLELEDLLQLLLDLEELEESLSSPPKVYKRRRANLGWTLSSTAGSVASWAGSSTEKGELPQREFASWNFSKSFRRED